MSAPLIVDASAMPDVRSVPTNNPAITGVLYNGDLLLFGWSFTELTGTAGAQVDLYDGGGAGSTLLASITLVAGESTRDPLGWPGIHCLQGVFVNVVAGQVRGAIWAADL